MFDVSQDLKLIRQRDVLFMWRLPLSFLFYSLTKRCYQLALPTKQYVSYCCFFQTLCVPMLPQGDCKSHTLSEFTKLRKQEQDREGGKICWEANKLQKKQSSSARGLLRSAHFKSTFYAQVQIFILYSPKAKVFFTFLIAQSQRHFIG